MPEPPPGEADLRALARRFEDVERRVRALVGKAPAGDRRALYSEASKVVTALRLEDFRAPVVTAYLAALRDVDAGAKARTVRDLSGSLAAKLDGGVQSVAGALRPAFKQVTEDNLDEVVEDAVTAHTDRSGAHWSLGTWAAMNCETIGRTASSRGTTDALGKRGKVMIEVSGCDYCAEFEGEAVVGDPLPPFHPNCTCVASPA